MSHHELLQEIGTLTEKARKAEQLGIPNEYAVYERKIALAKSYMVDLKQFTPGDTYYIEESGKKTSFKIQYLNGVFAWGYREQSEELEAVPVSVLNASAC
ncbi:YfhH family protein [Bacillaceae bacterium SIJ1]|nr:YfhH family protein [Litoribacterium kuwaitense]